MRLTKTRRGRLAMLTVLLAAGTLFAGIMPASVAQATNDNNGECTQLRFIEKIAAFYPGSSVTGVGAFGNFLDKLYAQDGTTQVGIGVGTYILLYQRPSDGHVFEYSTEQDQLPGGTVVISGYFDRTAMFEFQWVTLSVTGTSGQYLGMSGTVESRVQSFTEPGAPADDVFTLCRDDRDDD
jgi:hypothetical protein